MICVVEEPYNLVAIEKTRSYKGLYHILHGALSPIRGIGPDELMIANVFPRLMPENNEDVEVTALCDAYEPYINRNYSQVDDRWKAIGMIPKMGENFGNDVKKYADFRKLLEDKNVDAVCIATPDH